MKIAVIGAGIGGLAATLSLRAAGFDAHVFEQASQLTAVGAGIQIAPNASRLLNRLGLADALARHGVRPVGVHQRRWNDARTLQRASLNPEIEATFGAPYYHFHRADLLAALASGLPAGTIHLDHRLGEITERRGRVALGFADGSVVDADVVVGADGIHSRVRELLFGPERPRFTGCVAYRGLVPVERLSKLGLETVSSNWMGPGGHFVHYFVSGGRLHNFVAVKEQDNWTREAWTDRADVSEALDAFSGWHPTVRAIIGAVDETYKWALFDRDPLPHWTRGHVTLLGDAAHPMLPFMAQGACQAIEDGAALAACLRAGGGDVPAALLRYEQIRKPRATRLQELSRNNKIRFHLHDGPEQVRRDAELAARGDRTFPVIGWLYAHDAATLDPAA
jgi:salicylate hydroxylase